MFRRDFIQSLTVAGASGLAASRGAEALGVVTVTYRVTGFSCVTCAVGLEVMLRQQKGVIRAKANYPEATVAITFDSESISENTVKEFIAEKGFNVEKEPA